MEVSASAWIRDSRATRVLRRPGTRSTSTFHVRVRRRLGPGFRLRPELELTRAKPLWALCTHRLDLLCCSRCGPFVHTVSTCSVLLGGEGVPRSRSQSSLSRAGGRAFPKLGPTEAPRVPRTFPWTPGCYESSDCPVGEYCNGGECSASLRTLAGASLLLCKGGGPLLVGAGCRCRSIVRLKKSQLTTVRLQALLRPSRAVGVFCFWWGRPMLLLVSGRSE